MAISFKDALNMTPEQYHKSLTDAKVPDHKVASLVQQFNNQCKQKANSQNTANNKAQRTQEELNQESRKAQADKIDKIKKVIEANSKDPKKLESPPSDSAMARVNNILNFQLESVAIAALFNIIVHSMRAALGSQYVADILEYNDLKKIYIPFDPKLHHAGISVDDLEGIKNVRLLGDSSIHSYVPLCYDPKYHKVFHYNNKEGIVDFNHVIDNPDFKLTEEHASKLGIVVEPSILSSFNKEWRALSSKLNANHSSHPNNSSDEKNFMTQMNRGRPVPRPIGR